MTKQKSCPHCRKAIKEDGHKYKWKEIRTCDNCNMRFYHYQILLLKKEN
jgi:hypothetical protein